MTPTYHTNLDEARAHWGSDDYEGDPLIARRFLHALDWWESEGEAYREAAFAPEKEASS